MMILGLLQERSALIYRHIRGVRLLMEPGGFCCSCMCSLEMVEDGRVMVTVGGGSTMHGPVRFRHASCCLVCGREMHQRAPVTVPVCTADARCVHGLVRFRHASCCLVDVRQVLCSLLQHGFPGPVRLDMRKTMRFSCLYRCTMCGFSMHQ